MWARLKKLIHDCLTENDGTSYCPFRVTGFGFAAGGCPTFLACAAWTTFKTGHFDYMGFGGGFAAVMGGLGLLAAGVAVKAKTDK